MGTCIDAGTVAQIRRSAARDNAERRPIRANFQVGDELLGRQVLAHVSGRRLVLEVEPAQEGAQTLVFQQRLGEAIARVQGLADFATMFQDVTDIVAEISGYDRVSLYRFDEEYNGQVIAERIQPHHEPWFGLRYPASDIPKQARELYFRNRVRMLSDVRADQVFLRKHNDGAIRGATDGRRDARRWDLDLSLVDCRGLSPVHREYLENIGTAATMSIAIVLDGRLWGLFALHHDTPRYLDFELRGFLRFVGQVFSGHLALQTASEYRARVLEVNVNRSRLGDQISNLQEIGPALVGGDVTVMDLISACDGAVVSAEGGLYRMGVTPTEDQLVKLERHVRHESDDPLVYQTDHLCGEFEGAEAYREQCAGVLLVWLDRERTEYIAWFRSEIEKKVEWAGAPGKHEVATSDGGKRLAPRKSFAKYTEQVRNRAEAWSEMDVDAALGLRSHIKDVVLRRFQQVKRVNAELAVAYREMENFSYTVSHDLRAPLRSIDGFAEILKEDYGEVLDGDGIMMLSRIQDSTRKMNVFIDDLLELAKLGVSAIEPRDLDIGTLAREVYDQLAGAYAGIRPSTSPWPRTSPRPTATAAFLRSRSTTSSATPSSTPGTARASRSPSGTTPKPAAAPTSSATTAKASSRSTPSAPSRCLRGSRTAPRSRARASGWRSSTGWSTSTAARYGSRRRPTAGAPSSSRFPSPPAGEASVRGGPRTPPRRNAQFTPRPT